MGELIQSKRVLERNCFRSHTRLWIRLVQRWSSQRLVPVTAERRALREVERKKSQGWVGDGHGEAFPSLSMIELGYAYQ